MDGGGSKESCRWSLRPAAAPLSDAVGHRWGSDGGEMIGVRGFGRLRCARGKVQFKDQNQPAPKPVEPSSSCPRTCAEESLGHVPRFELTSSKSLATLHNWQLNSPDCPRRSSARSAARRSVGHARAAAVQGVKYM